MWVFLFFTASMALTDRASASSAGMPRILVKAAVPVVSLSALIPPYLALSLVTGGKRRKKKKNIP